VTGDRIEAVTKMTHSVLAVGDGYLSRADMARVLGTRLGGDFRIRYEEVDPRDRPSLPGLHEYQGDPRAVSDWLRDDDDVLLVHAAPVTAAILDAHPGVRIVACARGAAVNVDVEAARERGVRVLTTPAKNAPSVADLTMVFVHELMRGVGAAQDWLRRRAASGDTHLDSTFVGGLWTAREPRGATLGLVGFGAVGRLVAEQATQAGMSVLVSDPYLDTVPAPHRLVPLADLLAESDVVSLHARVTDANRRMVDADFFGRMRDGAAFVNTARESLLDEDALVDALAGGRLAGAALDVCEPDGRWPELALMPQVILTPHLGGATRQTQERGLSMLVDDLHLLSAGKQPLHAVA
jgi:phosphoglycerate dehydrogenase-like enzyme